MKHKKVPLTISHPQLANEWHKTKNGSLTPDQFTKGSTVRVWWQCCKCGHEWCARIKDRAIGGNGCRNRECYAKTRGKVTIDVTHPHLCDEWDYERNAPYKPSDFIRGSSFDAWWKCREQGHRYQEQIQRRTYGECSCPICCPNPCKVVTPETCLAATHPEIAKLVIPEKNPRLNAHNTNARAKVFMWFGCQTCGQPFQCSLDRLTKTNPEQRREPMCTRCIRAASKPNTKFKWCYYRSKKGGKKKLLCRSSYEFRAFLLLDLDPKVFNYCVEQETIGYHDDAGKKRKYIIDILVTYMDGSQTLVEIKPSHMLKDETVRAKAREAVKYAKKNGLRYKIWTEKKLFGALKRASMFGKLVKKGMCYSWQDFTALRRSYN